MAFQLLFVIFFPSEISGMECILLLPRIPDVKIDLDLLKQMLIAHPFKQTQIVHPYAHKRSYVHRHSWCMYSCIHMYHCSRGVAVSTALSILETAWVEIQRDRERESEAKKDYCPLDS